MYSNRNIIIVIQRGIAQIIKLTNRIMWCAFHIKGILEEEGFGKKETERDRCVSLIT